METKILEHKENKLIGRTEIKFEIVYEHKPPARAEAIESISTAARVQKDFFVLNTMANIFGIHKVAGIAHVYKNKEEMMKYETRNILIRNKLAEKKVKAVAAAPAAKKKGGK